MEALGYFSQGGAELKAWVRRAGTSFTVIPKTSDLHEEGDLVSVLSSHLVMIRRLHIPLKSKKKIEKILPFQLDEELPFSEKERVFDFIVRKDEVIVQATTTKNLEGFGDGAITTEVQSLFRYATKFLSIQEKILIVNKKEADTTVVLLDGEGIYNGWICRNKKEDYLRLLNRLRELKEIDSKTKLLLVGKEVEDRTPFEQFTLIQAIEKELAVPIGAAIDLLLDDEKTINFNKGKLSSKRKQLLLQKGKEVFFAACCFSLILFAGTFALIEAKKKDIEKEIAVLNKVLKTNLSEPIHHLTLTPLLQQITTQAHLHHLSIEEMNYEWILDPKKKLGKLTLEVTGDEEEIKQFYDHFNTSKGKYSFKGLSLDQRPKKAALEFQVEAKRVS